MSSLQRSLPFCIKIQAIKRSRISDIMKLLVTDCGNPGLSILPSSKSKFNEQQLFNICQTSNRRNTATDSEPWLYRVRHSAVVFTALREEASSTGPSLYPLV